MEFTFTSFEAMLAAPVPEADRVRARAIEREQLLQEVIATHRLESLDLAAPEIAIVKRAIDGEISYDQARILMHALPA